MPTYDYKCDACGHQLEIFHSMQEEPHTKCPACKKKKLRRLIGAGAGIIFKGSGFYITDYRSDGYKKRADADKAASSGSSSAGGESGGSSSSSSSSSGSSSSGSSSSGSSSSGSGSSGSSSKGESKPKAKD